MQIQNIEKFKPVLTGKQSIAEWGRALNIMVRQTASLQVQTFIQEAIEDNEYKVFSESILNSREGNFIIRIDDKAGEDILLIFKYVNKKHIYDFDGLVFYSSIEKEVLNQVLQDTIIGMHKIDIKNLLEVNNIFAEDEFVEVYEKNSIWKDLKLLPLDIIEAELVRYGKPMDKEELYSKTNEMGLKKTTVKNIIELTTNNKDKIVNLGNMVCDKDIFFKSYIDQDIANTFVLAAVAICEKNNICTTDVKWLSNKIVEEYPNIDIKRYNLHELKVILCNEEQFKKDVKFNVIYQDKLCQFSPSNINELLKDILKDFKLPVTFSFIVEKINERGKSFSKATLASLILPRDKDLMKLHNGWILKENEDYTKKLFKKINDLNLDNKALLEKLKKDYKVITLFDLAARMGVPLSLISDFYYGSTGIDFFIVRLNELNFKIQVDDTGLKLKKN